MRIRSRYAVAPTLFSYIELHGCQQRLVIASIDFQRFGPTGQHAGIQYDMVNARKRRHIIDIRRSREHQSPGRLFGRIREPCSQEITERRMIVGRVEIAHEHVPARRIVPESTKLIQ